MVTAFPVIKRLNKYSDIKRLYIRAFPKNERMPLWLLILSSLRKNNQFLAYYDVDTFCGIANTASTDKMVLITYLAVNDTIRSKGYGSAIIQQLEQLYKGKTITLNIEVLDENAENYEQRVRRYEFYRRNGFFDTGYKFEKDGVLLSILSNNKDFNIDDYSSEMKRLSSGFFDPKIK